MICYIKDSFNGASIRFSVYDELEKLKYKVVVEHLPFIMNIDIYDPLGKKVAKIRQKNMIILCAYNVYTKNKDFKFNVNLERPESNFKIKKPNWLFKGSVLNKNFSVFDADECEIMSQRTRILGSEKYYELNIKDEKNEVPCVCIALCIDTILTNNLKEALLFSEKEITKKRGCTTGYFSNKRDNC